MLLHLLFIVACSIEETLVEDRQPRIYDAGMRDLVFTDARGKELVMTVWYPSKVEGNRTPDSYEPFTIALSAFKSVKPAVIEAPLVAFSHGFFAIRYQSAFLMEFLAQNGYVVVAVDHPFNTLYDFDDSLTPEVLLNRPDDLKSAVDKVLELSSNDNDPFYNMVDGSQYAVMGHSFGSHTAMVLGGGLLNYAGVLEYCSQVGDVRACDYLNELEEEDFERVSEPDERVVLTVPMSPGLWYTFGLGGASLSNVRNPLVIAGQQDTVLEFETEALPTFQALEEPKILVEMENVGHYGMTNICDIAAFLSEECIGGAWTPIEDVQKATNYFVLQHLNGYFFGADWDANHPFQDWIQVRTSD